MTYHVQFPGLGLALTVNRVALSIGGFNIYWYGVIIAAGMMLALLYAFRNAVDFGIDSDRLVDVIAIGTVMAIVCARIYYVAMAPFKYNSIWEMIDIRLGGIAIYGAVIGAFVFGGLAATGVDALHFSARRERESGMRFRNPQVSMGGCAGVPEYTLTDADESVVRQILAELG